MSTMSNARNNDYGCYIRRQGQPWMEGRSHHRAALERFLEEEANGQGRVYRIAVPHTDGGEFIGWFRRLNQVVCQYTDEYGQQVGIMMSSSGHAGFASRIVESVNSPHL